MTVRGVGCRPAQFGERKGGSGEFGEALKAARQDRAHPIGRRQGGEASGGMMSKSSMSPSGMSKTADTRCGDGGGVAKRGGEARMDGGGRRAARMDDGGKQSGETMRRGGQDGSRSERSERVGMMQSQGGMMRCAPQQTTREDGGEKSGGAERMRGGGREMTKAERGEKTHGGAVKTEDGGAKGCPPAKGDGDTKDTALRGGPDAGTDDTPQIADETGFLPPEEPEIADETGFLPPTTTDPDATDTTEETDPTSPTDETDGTDGTGGPDETDETGGPEEPEEPMSMVGPGVSLAGLPDGLQPSGDTGIADNVGGSVNVTFGDDGAISGISTTQTTLDVDDNGEVTGGSGARFNFDANGQPLSATSSAFIGAPPEQPEPSGETIEFVGDQPQQPALNDNGELIGFQEAGFTQGDGKRVTVIRDGNGDLAGFSIETVRPGENGDPGSRVIENYDLRGALISASGVA